MTAPHFRLAGIASVVVFLLSWVAHSHAETVQRGNLRVAFSGSFAPKALPRQGTSPIAVTVGGQISTTDGAPPPQLQAIQIAINRAGRLDTAGLPTCAYDEIQPSTTAAAQAACGPAKVGEGSFAANVLLPEQSPFPSAGKIVAFNGTIPCSAGRSVGPPFARTRYRSPPAVRAQTAHTTPTPQGRRDRRMPGRAGSAASRPSRSGGHAALIQNQPFPSPQSQSDSPEDWGKAPPPPPKVNRTAPPPPLEVRTLASPAAPSPGRVWPSSSRTQGGRQGDLAPASDPQATDRGQRDAPCHTRPAILAHVYGTVPIPLSYTLVLTITPGKGQWGTVLNAALPEVTSEVAYVTGISLTLDRRFSAGGQTHGYVSAGCPAPKGFPGATFPLAKVAFAFGGAGTLGTTLTRSCTVRR